MIGTTVSHYRVLESVGVGGMGIIYLAEDTRLNRKVALKFLPPAIAQDLHARARFRGEAQAASALDHPNVATIYEIGDWEQQLFIPGLDHLPAVKLHDFGVDRHEVTNREFKTFVDAGGYRSPAFWQHPFSKDGRTLTFDQAIAQFTDSTGRPGSATWELGSFPEGQDDFPVTGVSWYEAAAFAAYSGKSLPTIYHWSRVAEQRFSGIVVPRSNFGGRAAMTAGASRAINRFGAVDMAGNVKEWTWNRADASRRYILGGAWDEPVYMANDPDARSPFERATNVGFRCVKYSPDESLAGAGAELVAFEARDFDKETPVKIKPLISIDAYTRTPRAT